MEYILFILDWNKMVVLMECFFLVAMLWVRTAEGVIKLFVYF